MYPQTKDIRRQRKDRHPQKEGWRAMTEVPAKCPPNLPIRVLLDLVSLGQATSEFWLPFRCLFRQRADQGPEGRKFHLQWILHYLKKSFWSPKPTLVLD